jgi:hypothetical protein
MRRRYAFFGLEVEVEVEVAEEEEAVVVVEDKGDEGHGDGNGNRRATRDLKCLLFAPVAKWVCSLGAYFAMRLNPGCC